MVRARATVNIVVARSLQNENFITNSRLTYLYVAAAKSDFHFVNRNELENCRQTASARNATILSTIEMLTISHSNSHKSKITEKKTNANCSMIM